MLSFRLAVPSHDWLESIISVAARDGVNIIVGKYEYDDDKYDKYGMTVIVMMRMRLRMVMMIMILVIMIVTSKRLTTMMLYSSQRDNKEFVQVIMTLFTLDMSF